MLTINYGVCKLISCLLVLGIAKIVLTVQAYLSPIGKARLLIHQANRISGAQFCIVLATSLTATIIISVHIYSSTTHSNRSRRRFQKIVDILLQSSVAYTAAVIPISVSGFLNTGVVDDTALTVTILGRYSSRFGSIIMVSFPQYFTLLTDCVIPFISIGTCADTYGSSVGHTPCA